MAVTTLTLVSCKDAIKPTFESVENFKPGQFGLAEMELSADIRFKNENTFGLKLKTIECDLYIDSVFAGHFNSIKPVKVRAKESFLLPVTGRASTLVIAENTKKAIEGKPAIVRVVGQARVGRFIFGRTVPFDYRDTIVLKL